MGHLRSLLSYDLSLPIVGRLLLAAVLGGLIGLEREFRRKPAGLRTNMFLCVGAALFTILSYAAADRYGGDHVRIAAQIIPGIGFIGAGAILRERGGVVGLTTAATMFVVASIGMAAGFGMYYTAVFSAVLILIALTVLGWVAGQYGLKSRLVAVRCTTSSAEPALKQVHQIFDQIGVPIQHFQIHRVGTEFVLEFDADLSYRQQHEVMRRLSAVEGRWEVIPLDFQPE